MSGTWDSSRRHRCPVCGKHIDMWCPKYKQAEPLQFRRHGPRDAPCAAPCAASGLELGADEALVETLCAPFMAEVPP